MIFGGNSASLTTFRECSLIKIFSHERMNSSWHRMHLWSWHNKAKQVYCKNCKRDQNWAEYFFHCYFPIFYFFFHSYWFCYLILLWLLFSSVSFLRCIRLVYFIFAFPPFLIEALYHHKSLDKRHNSRAIQSFLFGKQNSFSWKSD